ncbi:50S ribosomal protein L14e [Candidatus Woesearchaeota archaeon]|nr:50S ribosomal protein L14e [Candidatus Woesearchaeota archaeon]
MIDVGRICVKIAGRDAGLKCVVVDKIDKNFVMIDGQTRRKRCSILHLEPLDLVLDIKKNAGHEEVKKGFNELGLKLEEKKSRVRKERQKGSRSVKKEKKIEKEIKKK